MSLLRRSAVHVGQNWLGVVGELCVAAKYVGLSVITCHLMTQIFHNE